MTDASLVQGDRDDRLSAAPRIVAPAGVRGRFWVACAVALPANLIWCVWTLSVNQAGPWFDECPLLANVLCFLLLFVGVKRTASSLPPRVDLLPG